MIHDPSDKKIKGGFETMNKNLKKVISAVAALALSVSSFVAMASYPDVADTDKHASAINELSALGVIEGFEDGSFHPDELVTRAQMAAMVVRAMNIANADSNKVQKFNDVPADNWAAGWIATAADNNLINGTGNGNFDPDLNVTYAQTAKMLVAACGYDTWAVSAGGWPSGYLRYAAQTGITNNISNVTNDTAITRAQAAQMIANALEAPMLDTVSYSTSWDGTVVPIMNIFDGTTDERSPYKTLLSQKWNAYVVNGTVTETPKSNDSLKDKVKYTIDRARNYNGESIGYASVRPVGPTTLNIDAYIGTSGADNFLNSYTEAIVLVDDYDEATIAYIEVSAKSDTVELNTNLYADFTTANGRNYLEFYKSASTQSTTRYELADDWKLVVNGVEITNDATNRDFYLNKNSDNPNAKVVLTDNPSGGTTDSKYDVVEVSYKVTAVVDSVSDKTTETIVNFKDQTSVGTGATFTRVESKLTLVKDDDTKSYSFTKDGVAINATDLQENDILTISFNPSVTFRDSSFYDVVVSQAKVEGKVTNSATNEYDQPTFTIGGTVYTIANGMSISNISIGNEYVAYLTVDGEIAYCDKLASSVTYGVLDRVYKANSGEEKAMIIGKDGVRREYEIDTNTELKTLLNQVKAETGADRYDNVTLDERVVDYTITSSNKIRFKDGSDIMVSEFLNTEKNYTASTSRLGSYMIDDASIILDMSQVISGESTTASVVTKADFVDGSTYKGVVVRDSSSSAADAYPFVLITEGFGGFNVDTQMAVVKKVSATSSDGADRTQLDLYINGDVASEMCVDTSSTYSDLDEGDVIIYTKDSDGYIDEVIEVFKAGYAPSNVADKYGYLKAIAGGDTVVSSEATIDAQSAKIVNSDPDLTPTRDGEAVKYVFGPVIARDANSVTVGAVGYGNTKGDKTTTTTGNNAYFTDIAGTVYAYESTVKVYTYNGQAKSGYRVESGNGGSVANSAFGRANSNTTSHLDTAGEWINLGMAGEGAANPSVNTVSFVLLRVYDDRVQEVYSIAMSDDDYKAEFQAK